MRLARLAPLIAFLTLYLPAERLAAEPLSSLTPPLDFPAHASALEAVDDPDSLVRAAVLRRALGEIDRADVDSARFLDQLAAAPGRAERAAGAYLAEFLDPAAWPDTVRWEAVLRRFLALVSGSAASPALQSVRTGAQVLLAAHLWQASCPLSPQQRSDAACIQRIDATAEYEASYRAKREAARQSGKPFAFVPSSCGAPLYRYVVPARRPALAREAQALLTQVLRRAPTLSRARPQDTALQEAFARALFLRAEPRFEAALANRLPLDLFSSPKNPRRIATQRARLDAWLVARTNLPSHGTLSQAPAVREHTLYEAVTARGVPAWSAAAYARLAQLSLDVTDQWARARPEVIPKPPPPPAGMDPGEWAVIFQDAYCDQRRQDDLLFERETLAALTGCSDEAIGAALDTPYVRTCIELHDRLRPLETNLAREIFAPPSWQVPLAQARSEPTGAGSLLR